MAIKIGVRELKNRASEIVREVHEQDAEFIVTLRGSRSPSSGRCPRRADASCCRRRRTRPWRRSIAWQKNRARLALSGECVGASRGATALEMPVMDAACTAFFNARKN
jgi:hypothetical protein